MPHAVTGPARMLQPNPTELEQPWHLGEAAARSGQSPKDVSQAHPHMLSSGGKGQQDGATWKEQERPWARWLKRMRQKDCLGP